MELAGDEMRSLTLKVESIGHALDHRPDEGVDGQGVVSVSAWLMSAFKKAFWRWIRP